jgi:hypothetical protein
MMSSGKPMGMVLAAPLEKTCAGTLLDGVGYRR